MRKGLIGTVLAIAAGASAILLAGLSRKRLGPSPVEPRFATFDASARASLSPVVVARSSSLWTDALGTMCRVAHVHGTGAIATAEFGGLMRLSLRAAQQRAPAIAARAAAWVARDQLLVAAANDADVADQFVTIEPGATPVVRLIKTGSIRPRRATFGSVEAVAA
jgi:hypothetical protein